MTVGELIQQLANIDPHIDVYFRKAPPIAGTITSVERINEDFYSFFGVPVPCVILETYNEDDEKDVNDGV